MPDQSKPAGAVFLSYGSENADAAERICNALRTAGVEVWLDKTELRGGDAWDAHIKKQIHDCALFVPLISAHTNARSEGYFRREWKLATRRLLDIADDAAFLMPVVIDATREADARVPEEFLGVQWTRLPNGEASPAFVHRVCQLLGGDGAAARNSQTAVAGNTEPNTRKGLSVRPWFWFVGGRGKHRMGGAGIALIVLLLALGAGALWYNEGASKAPAEPSTSTASPIAPVAPNMKSIAVLPFANMSSDPEQEYFSDGISEELLNLLAKIPELRVISRSSAFSFKGKDIEVPEIAKRLNVAHVLEGSVRKSGNQVRIAAQLIEAHSDTHLWSEIYDRELTDIFAVQDEIALAVVQQLKLTLLGDDLPARSKTTSLEAYTLYLRGQHLIDQNTEVGFGQAVEFFGKALEYDPYYGDAWAALANAQSWIGTQAGYAEARASAQKALDLDPNLARAHFALGQVQLHHDWDWLAANGSFQKAIALDPSDSWGLAYAGAMALLLGTEDDGISLFKQAVAHDPIAILPRNGLALSNLWAGHLDEAESEIRTVLKLSPEFISAGHTLGMILLLKGQATSALVAIQEEPHEIWRLAGLSLAYHAAGQKEASNEILKEFTEKYADVSAYLIAEAHAFRGEKEEAFAWLDRAYRQRDAGLVFIRRYPLLEKIRSDSRYTAMLRKLKLPET